MAKHKAKMATLKIEEGQIEKSTKELISDAVKRGLKLTELQKSQIKYKVISKKMNDYVKNPASTAGLGENRRRSLHDTQTSWQTIQPLDLDAPTDP